MCESTHNRCGMCQMLNIWHISHTKLNLSPFSRCGIWYFFCNIEQYCDKFATVRKKCGILFIVCLFLSLSFLRRSPLSLTPILSSQTPTLTALPRPHPRPRRSLSSNGFSLFFFFFFWLWFDGWVGQWVGLDGLGYRFRWMGQRWVGMGLLC